jgi:branched-chain amino acid transport system permease protein
VPVGVLIGALEIFWAGYLNLAHRDFATFAVLAAVLICGPHGLLGQPVRLANDAFRPRPI